MARLKFYGILSKQDQYVNKAGNTKVSSIFTDLDDGSMFQLNGQVLVDPKHLKVPMDWDINVGFSGGSYGQPLRNEVHSITGSDHKA